jgi:AcrR family transcriptional regulator
MFMKLRSRRTQMAEIGVHAWRRRSARLSGAMSPRKPAVLRDGDGDGQNLRDYLITTAARLIDERGSAGLGVRDISRAAQVADGVLYNYFEDKEDLLAHALLAHVATVMEGMPPMPPAGTGTVAENLRQFIDIGIGALARVVPPSPGCSHSRRFSSGSMRWSAEMPRSPATRRQAATGGRRRRGRRAGGTRRRGSNADRPGGLPGILTAYLRAEQQTGPHPRGGRRRCGRDAGLSARSTARSCRGFSQPAGSSIMPPPDLAGRPRGDGRRRHRARITAPLAAPVAGSCGNAVLSRPRPG